MTVLFDDKIFNLQQYGGISRYFANLIKGLPRHGVEVKHNNKFSYNEYLLCDNISENPDESSLYIPGKTRVKKLLGLTKNKTIEYYLKQSNYDVFHPTYYQTEFLNTDIKRPFVVTVHDMIHESYFNPLFETITHDSFEKMEMIKRAAKLIVVSETTKDQLLSYCPNLNENKISVIYHANPFENIEIDSVEPFSIHHEYLLYVGTRRFYKNFLSTVVKLKAFLKRKKLKLLCAGGSDFSEYEKLFFMENGLTDFIEFVPFKSDLELASLYRGATAFIFPSMQEGFGIPILEAFSMNCPVVLNDIACFREVAGEAAYYFKNDEGSLQDSLESIMTDKIQVTRIIKSGKERVNAFTLSKNLELHRVFFQSV